MRRLLSAALSIAVCAVILIASTSGSEAVATPSMTDGAAREASTDGAPQTPCMMTMSGGMSARVDCGVVRNYWTSNWHDAARPVSELRIRSVDAHPMDPSADVRIFFLGKIAVGPQFGGTGWTEARVEEGRPTAAREAGAVAISWAGKSDYRTMTLTVTSVQSAMVGGQLVSVVHGELDARLAVENVAINYAPSDVSLHVTF